MKKNLLYLLIIAFSVAFTLNSCSDDDGPRDPYLFQEKTPFYPSKITIEKKNQNREIFEEWSFVYNQDNTINSYTHNITTKRNRNGNEEITTEKENGKLDYFSNGEILNSITYDYYSTNQDNTTNYQENINETAYTTNGIINSIKRLVRKSNGVTYYTNQNFAYENNHCVRNELFKDETLQYRYDYKWDGEHKLNEVEKDDYSGATRVRVSSKYTYGEENKNYGFKPEAFIYDNLPYIYAAMGMFDKSVPYTIEKEKQIVEFFEDNKWEKDNNAADCKYFTIIENRENNLKVDIASDIFDNIYYISYTK